LPDPTNETDLTCFITLWKEESDTSLKKSVESCQVAENVINSMQNIQGEAMAMFDEKVLKWTQHYSEMIRDI
jgi:hypothetical protein